MYSQDIIELYQNGVQIVLIVFNSNNENHDQKKKKYPSRKHMISFRHCSRDD